MRQCLICYNEAPSSGESPNQEANNISLIDKQLNGIFILKELLSLPSNFLGKWLKMCPEVNPDSWISLCKPCGEMVGEGRRIFEEIVNARMRFKVIQEKVVRKIKVSKMTSNCAKNRKKIMENTVISEVITEESRRFVGEYDYGHFEDPFIAGDLEASLHVNIETDGYLPVKQETDEEFVLGPGVQRQSGDYFDDHFERYSHNDCEPPSMDNVEVHGHSESQKSGDNDVKPKSRVRKSMTLQDPPTRKKKAWNRLIDQEGAFMDSSGKVAFRCQIESCSKVYRKQRHYQIHKMWHSGEKPSFPCDQCEKVYTSDAGLFLHKKSIHQNIPTVSPAKKEKLQLQLRRKCPHCDVTTNKYDLAIHIKRVHEKIYNLYCEICGKGEGGRRDMRYHQVVAHGICSVEGCKLAFPGDRPGLRDHQLQVHGMEIDMFPCDQCDKLFVRMDFLAKHRKLHEYKKMGEGKGGGEGEWICDQCGKSFALKEKLASHMSGHRKQARRKMERSKKCDDEDGK